MHLIRTNNPKKIALLNEPVQNLHHSLYPERFKAYEFQGVLSYFEKVINEENHHFIVCVNNEMNLGYIWFEEILHSETAFSNPSHYLYVHQISVNEEYRGMGIGKLLFSSILELAEEKSINRIGLDYWVKNDSAKMIYEKMGFKLEKEITYLNL
jgi:ribosomal protein S18 acetylase RimI-like enzyme